MPAYNWSCYACATANQSNVEQCVRCGCPAAPCQREIEEFRQTLVATGTSIPTELAGAPFWSDQDARQLRRILAWIPYLPVF